MPTSAAAFTASISAAMQSQATAAVLKPIVMAKMTEAGFVFTETPDGIIWPEKIADVLAESLAEVLKTVVSNALGAGIYPPLTLLSDVNGPVSTTHV